MRQGGFLFCLFVCLKAQTQEAVEMQKTKSSDGEQIHTGDKQDQHVVCRGKEQRYIYHLSQGATANIFSTVHDEIREAMRMATVQLYTCDLNTFLSNQQCCSIKEAFQPSGKKDNIISANLRSRLWG